MSGWKLINSETSQDETNVTQIKKLACLFIFLLYYIHFKCITMQMLTSDREKMEL